MSAAEDDLRSQLEAAFKGEPENVDTPEVETPEVETVETPEVGRARDEKGRFVPKAEELETEQAPEQAATEETTPDAPALAPPNGWSAEAKAKWHELPPEIQAAALKREEDVAKFTSKSDDERNFGREMFRTVQPYMAQIQAEGGTPVSAVKSLLNTAYVLRTGSQQQKTQMLLQVAREYGIDLGQPNQEQPTLDPVMQRIARLESTLTQREQAEVSRLQTEVQTELEAFAADPAHPHFSEVKAHMAALLREGAARDLQDAYEQACWASPTVRATLQAQQRAEEEQKRKAEAKRRAEEAKSKSIGITGGPGNTAAKSAPESRSLREELEAQMAASVGAV